MSDEPTLADLLRELNTARRSNAADARELAGPRPGQVVDHIDGNAWNNDPSNLRIVDPRENATEETAR